MGEERLIVSGMTAEENPWGKYQFPLPYRVDDRIIVSVHVENDTLINTGNPTRWFESKDDGDTWTELSPDIAAQCGLKLPCGDRIYFPVVGGVDLSDYMVYNTSNKLVKLDHEANLMIEDVTSMPIFHSPPKLLLLTPILRKRC